MPVREFRAKRFPHTKAIRKLLKSSPKRAAATQLEGICGVQRKEAR
jgi:hypothetical protein